MDTSAYRRASRRSHLSLGQLTIAPLTQLPLTAAPLDDDNDAATAPRPSSYLASRSVPQTPSILSRSSSRVRRHRASSSHALDGLDGDPAPSCAVRPSRSALHPPGSGRRTPARVRVSSDTTDLLLRTASSLMLAASESKGQAWLAARSSSTSLADAAAAAAALAPHYEAPGSAAYRADDEYSPASLRHGSKAQSKGASRAASRRGSRASLSLATPSGAGPRGYFDGMGADFVDGGDEAEYRYYDNHADDDDDGGSGEDGYDDVDDDDDGVEEGELRRLIRGRVGGLWDYYVGWLDFRSGEDDEDEAQEGGGGGGGGGGADDGNEGKPGAGNGPDRRRRRRAETDRVRVESTRELGAVDVPPPERGGGAVSDTVWLLRLASRVLI